MPYYIGEDMPEWAKYFESDAGENGGDPERSLFKYILPESANATIVYFKDIPGPKPPPAPERLSHPRPAQKIGFFGRLFGKTPEPELPGPTQEQWIENHKEREKALLAIELWNLSNTTTARRNMGIKRVIGSYDGGHDESFTHFQAVEMNNGDSFQREHLPSSLKDVKFEKIIDAAVGILMGSYGDGPFILRGAVTIDFDACTITDEKDADIVFQYEERYGE